MKNLNLKIGKSVMLYSLPVNLIRQWMFCPRVVYYQELLNVKIQYPLWVRQGEEHHILENELFKRRNLSRFKLSEGKKIYNQYLKSDNLKLHGVSDMIIENKDQIYVVENKCSFKVTKGSIFQTVAYSMLAEEFFNKKSSTAFITTLKNQVTVLSIDQEMRQKVLNIRDKIYKMLDASIKPFSSANIHQCGQCEYINYCNDR